MQPPQQCVAKLADKIQFNEKFVHYTFEFTQPATIQFEAGQYVSIQVSDRGDRRSYSICHSPEVTHGFELLVDITPQGLGTKFLESMKFGDTLKALAPLGRFTVPIDPTEKALVFIATGSGIAPFRSMIVDQLQLKNDQRPMTLYWGLRNETQLFWQDEFEELMRLYPNFKFHPVISQAGEMWSLCRGRVTDCLSVHELPAEAGYFLCGNAPMIHDVVELLAKKGVANEHVHHEKFY
jgi:ferredoxin-NADP reductase